MTTYSRTVREIALDQPSSIRVFEAFGIDYCCGGHRPLEVACSKLHISVASVAAALELAAANATPATNDWADSSLEQLSQHIVSTHHVYVMRELPRLSQLAAKVVARHGSTTPSLIEIQALMARLDAELTQHLAKEEQILFPYIARLEQWVVGGGDAPQGCFQTVASPIAAMTQEHEAAGALLGQIRQLSNQFVVPTDACPTYHAFFDGLHEFEQDLHQHIHLENNIFFPRAIKMEAASLTVAG